MPLLLNLPKSSISTTLTPGIHRHRGGIPVACRIFGATVPDPGMSDTCETPNRNALNKTSDADQRVREGSEGMGTLLKKLLIAAAPFIWRKYRERGKGRN